MGSKQTAIRTVSLSHSLQLYRCQLIDGVSLLARLADSLHYPYQIFSCRQLPMEADGFTYNCQLMPTSTLIWISIIFIHISCPLLHILVAFNWRVMELSFSLVNCLLVRGAKFIYGRLLEQPSLNAQTRVASRLALLLDEGVASSSVHFPFIYNLSPPLISPISSVLISGEREPVTLTSLIYWLCCLFYYRHFRNHLPLRRHTCKFSFFLVFYSNRLTF